MGLFRLGPCELTMGTACSKGDKSKSKTPVKAIGIKKRGDDDDFPSQGGTNQSATDGHSRQDDVIDIEVSQGNIRSQSSLHDFQHDGGAQAEKSTSPVDNVKKTHCTASDDDDESDNDDIDGDNNDGVSNVSNHNSSSSNSESDEEVDSPPVSEDEQDELKDDSRPPLLVNTGNVVAYTSSDERVGLACKGRFDFDMPQNIKIVRIFTSSTFTGILFIYSQNFIIPAYNYNYRH